LTRGEVPLFTTPTETREASFFTSPVTQPQEACTHDLLGCAVRSPPQSSLLLITENMSDPVSSNTQSDCFGDILALLSGFEVTPFGAPPTFVPITPPSLAKNPSLSSIQNKIYALAIRAYTAENTVLSLSRGGILAQPVSHPRIGGIVDLERSVARIEAGMDVGAPSSLRRSRVLTSGSRT
jgi:hypothetical protein